MDEDIRQYRVRQTLIIELRTDVFDTSMPNAEYLEELLPSALAEKHDVKVDDIHTRYLQINDLTR